MHKKKKLKKKKTAHTGMHRQRSVLIELTTTAQAYP